MDWITTANGLIALITGLCGLILTGVTTYFGVKVAIKNFKEKDAKQKWETIKAIADSVMITIEEKYRKGTLAKEKKFETALDLVNNAAKSAGVDTSKFTGDLKSYINTSIEWYNNMSGKK